MFVASIDFALLWMNELTSDRIGQTKLTTLDVGNNSIPEIENLSHLRHLTDLWVRIIYLWRVNSWYIANGQVNHNKIETLRALEPQLGSLPLETIYLEGNPCQEVEGANYRRKIMLALPSTLTQIDATWVTSSIPTNAFGLNPRPADLRSNRKRTSCFGSYLVIY